MSRKKNFSKRQVIAAIGARDQALQGAPGKVLEAFFPEQISICDLTLQPVTLATYMLLEKIGSPLVSKPQCTLEDVLRAVVILSRPVPEARAIVADANKLETMVWELAGKLPVDELKEIGEKIAAHIAAAFSTIIKGDKKDDSLGESPRPAAGSAGSQP